MLSFALIGFESGKVIYSNVTLKLRKARDRRKGTFLNKAWLGSKMSETRNFWQH